MQEDIEHRAVTLVVNTSKMTARGLMNAIRNYLRHRQNKGTTGKQSVKRLVRQGQGVTNIEITDQNIKSFDRVARKYGVDYALKKDISGDSPKYLVFFKARDADALTSAFKEFTAKQFNRSEKPSVLERLRTLKAKVKAPKIKHKELER